MPAVADPAELTRLKCDYRCMNSVRHTAIRAHAYVPPHRLAVGFIASDSRLALSRLNCIQLTSLWMYAYAPTAA